MNKENFIIKCNKCNQKNRIKKINIKGINKCAKCQNILIDTIEKDSIKNNSIFLIQVQKDNKKLEQKYKEFIKIKDKIDNKIFEIEAPISYIENTANIDISQEDEDIIKKIKSHIDNMFLYKTNVYHNFGVLIECNNNVLTFELNNIFLKQFTNKNHTLEIISNKLDTNNFIIKARQHIERGIKIINQDIIYKDKKENEINVKKSIENMPIKENQKNKLVDIWNRLSNKIHNEDAEDIDKNKVNKILKIIENQKNFNPPKKIKLSILEPYEIKILKLGLKCEIELFLKDILLEKKINSKIVEMNKEKNKYYNLKQPQAQARAKKRKEIDNFNTQNNQELYDKYPDYFNNKNIILELKQQIELLEKEKKKLLEIKEDLEKLNTIKPKEKVN